MFEIKKLSMLQLENRLTKFATLNIMRSWPISK